MCTECSLNVPRMFPECSLNVPAVERVDPARIDFDRHFDGCGLTANRAQSARRTRTAPAPPPHHKDNNNNNNNSHQAPRSLYGFHRLISRQRTQMSARAEDDSGTDGKATDTTLAMPAAGREGSTQGSTQGGRQGSAPPPESPDSQQSDATTTPHMRRMVRPDASATSTAPSGRGDLNVAATPTPPSASPRALDCSNSWRTNYSSHTGSAAKGDEAIAGGGAVPFPTAAAPPPTTAVPPPTAAPPPPTPRPPPSVTNSGGGGDSRQPVDNLPGGQSSEQVSVPIHRIPSDVAHANEEAPPLIPGPRGRRLLVSASHSAVQVSGTPDSALLTRAARERRRSATSMSIMTPPEVPSTPVPPSMASPRGFTSFATDHPPYVGFSSSSDVVVLQIRPIR
jgi:hypothetical protein